MAPNDRQRWATSAGTSPRMKVMAKHRTGHLKGSKLFIGKKCSCRQIFFLLLLLFREGKKKLKDSTK